MSCCWCSKLLEKWMLFMEAYMLARREPYEEEKAQQDW
jgi:hypothetical protein